MIEAILFRCVLVVTFLRLHIELAATAKMLVCLSFARVLDSEKVKTTGG